MGLDLQSLLRLRPTTVTCQSGTRLHVHYNTHTNYKYKWNTIRNTKIKKYKVMNNPHIIKLEILGAPKHIQTRNHTNCRLACVRVNIFLEGKRGTRIVCDTF